MRLRKVKDKYGDEVAIITKAYALNPGVAPGRYITPHSIQGRMASAADGAKEGAIFNPWPQDKFYPNSSMPALEAAKCATLQGVEAFQRYDLGLYDAFFTRCEDISERDVLVEVARRAELDAERFAYNLDSRSQKSAVMAEHIECVRKFGSMARGVPLLSINDGPPLVGAYPIEVWFRAIDRAAELARA